MNFRQLEYIIAIADEGNITKAAMKIYITQSALNQQLLKLEKELGAELFHRSKTVLIPTKIGEIYIRKAKEILEIKKDTYNQIEDITRRYRETIKIGLTPERGMHILASVYPSFYKMYPGIKIEPVEVNVDLQQKMIESGELDIGFVNLTEEEKTRNKYILIGKEKLLLAVPRQKNSLLKKDFLFNKISISEFSLLKNEKFVLLPVGTTIRNMIDEYFNKAEFVPDILFETKSSQTLLKMVQNSTACTIISEIHANKSENIEYFSFAEKMELEYCAAYKKGRYITEPIKKIVELFRDYWEKSI